MVSTRSENFHIRCFFIVFKVNEFKVSSYVNFINVLRTKFSYKRRIGSLESGFERTFIQKMRAKNVDEIDFLCFTFQFLLALLKLRIPCALIATTYLYQKSLNLYKLFNEMVLYFCTSKSVKTL